MMSGNHITPCIGDVAPSFTAQTTHGTINFPKDYEGKYVILFSHAADFTPVCTTEFVAFAKRYEQFKQLNSELIGLSIDQVYSHIKWVEWIKWKLSVDIEFPIIADNRGRISSLYGMLHSEANNSQTVSSVFMIDTYSIIRAIMFYPNSIGRNVDEIIRLLKAIRTSDQKEVALPAGWPNNEIIGNKVIVPAATNELEAQERLKVYESFDWWFCYTKLEQ
jgi:peroxiredoxin (alkyl hydroperoxide reductase subunit C)